MKVKGRSENALRLCQEVESRLPKHPLFDNFRKGLKQLQNQTKKKLVVTVINDLPQDGRYVSYRQFMSQMLGSEVASCLLRTNVYLNYNPTLDFKVSLPSGDTFIYSKDKRELQERYLPEALETESFVEAVQHILKKYPASEDFYPLLRVLLSLKTPAPGIKVEILSPNGIENVTLLFPLGNEVDARESYWKNFLDESVKADKVQAASQAQAQVQAQSKSQQNTSPSQSQSISSTQQEIQQSNKTQNQSQVVLVESIRSEKHNAIDSKTEQSNAQPKAQSHPGLESSSKSTISEDRTTTINKQANTKKTTASSKNNGSKSVAKSAAKSPSISSSDKENKPTIEYAEPDVVKAKFIEALEEANAFLVLSSIDELLTHNFLGLLNSSHPLLSKNTIVILEGDSQGLPGQQLNDLLALSLGASSPIWMYYRSADPESFVSEIRSFVNGSTHRLEDTFITGMACTELEIAAKDLKKMIQLLTQEKKTAMSEGITPLDDYFYYYFSQARLNDLIRKRTKDFRDNFPNIKAKILDYVSERINASITSDELMNILDDREIRKLCEYQYIISHQYYLDRQHKLCENFNLQLVRLYSEFEANYHVDPLELELQFDKEDPIYRYKVSFDIFERMLNALMKNTSDLEQAKAHMMNSVLAKFQEDYLELENYYVYHFRKSMQTMEQGVEKIRKEYHKFYRESIDKKSNAFISRINGLQSQLNLINDILEMLRRSPISNNEID